MRYSIFLTCVLFVLSSQFSLSQAPVWERTNTKAITNPVLQVYASAELDLLAMLKKPGQQIYRIDVKGLFDKINNINGPFDLNLKMGQENITTRLEKQELRGKNYRGIVYTDSGIKYLVEKTAPENCYTYSGYVQGQRGRLFMYLSPGAFKLSYSGIDTKSWKITPANAESGFIWDKSTGNENDKNLFNSCATQATNQEIASCPPDPGQACSYDNFLDAPIRVLDWALEADNEFFNNHHPFGPELNDETRPAAIEYVESYMLEIVFRAHEFFFWRFQMQIRAVEILMYASEQDPYEGFSIKELWNQMKVKWNLDSNRKNIPYDAAQLLTGKSMVDAAGFVSPTGGGLDNVCTGYNPPFSFGYQQNFAVSRHPGSGIRPAVSAHELIHNIGQGPHSNEPPFSDICPNHQCPDNNSTQEIIMCSEEGNNMGDWIITFVEQCNIYNKIVQTDEIGKCLGTEEPEYCPGVRSLVSYDIVATDNTLVVNCPGEDETDFTVTVCNTCTPRDITVEFHLNPSGLALLSAPPTFPLTSAPSPVSSMLVMYEAPPFSFNAEECKTFVFRAKLTAGAGTPAAGVRLRADGTISTFKNTLVSADDLDALTVDVLTGSERLSQNTADAPFNGVFPSVASSCTEQALKRYIFDSTNRLEVDIDYCMTNDEFLMKAGSKIVVMPGVTLKLKNCKFFSCNDMWDFIQVSRGATVEAEDCQFIHGINGFKVDPGGTLRTRNCTFINNHIGIEAKGSAQLPAEVLVSGGVFKTEGVLLPPYAGKLGYAGIRADNVLNVQVLGWVEARVSFDRLVNGIITKDCALQVEEVNFSRISPLSGVWQGSPWGIGIQAFGQDANYADLEVTQTDFEQCRRGISAQKTHVSITDAGFKETIYGISVDYCRNRIVSINNNTIEAKTIGIGMTHNEPALIMLSNNAVYVDAQTAAPGIGAGILINELPFNNQISNYNVVNNSISVINGQAGIRQYDGAFTYLAENNVSLTQAAYPAVGFDLKGMYRPWIGNNTITGPEAGYVGRDGIVAEGLTGAVVQCNTLKLLDKGTWFRLVNDGTRLRGNTYQRAREGLRLGNLLAGGSIENAAIGQQSHQGNRWTGPFDIWGAFHASDNPFLWVQSLFLVNSQADPAYLPANNIGGSGWFVDDNSSTTAFNCPVPPADPIWPGETDDDKLDQAIAADSFGMAGYETGSAWIGKQRLLRRWGSAGASGPLVAPFLAAQSGSLAEDYREADAAFEAALAMSAQDWAAITASLSALHNARAGLWQNALAYPWTGRTALLQSMLTAQQSLGQVQDSRMAAQDQALAIAKVSAGSLTAHTTIQINHKSVLDIYARMMLGGFTALNATDSLNLLGIASACPLVGGDAVYRARALFGVFNPEALHNANCPSPSGSGGQALRGNADSPALQARIHPNPGRDYFVVSANQPLTTGQSAHILLLDALQRAWPAPCRWGEQNTLMVDTAALPPGLYWLLVQTADGQTQVLKWIKY